MQSIKRMMLLLKPSGSLYRSFAAVRLQETTQAISLSLKTDMLKIGNYELYLFLRDKSLLFAGNLKDGCLYTTLYDILLSDIEGGAIVDADKDSLCLKSTNLDRFNAIERLKIKRTPKKKEPSSANFEPIEQAKKQTEQPPVNTDVHEPISYEPMPYEPKPDDPEPDEPKSNEPVCDYNQSDMTNTGSCPSAKEQREISPFPSVFPHSKWVKISYLGPSGLWHYISGEIHEPNSVITKALGVPGQYAVSPPSWLEGFDTYLPSNEESEGYWLMFWNSETGEVTNPALSPHDA